VRVLSEEGLAPAALADAVAATLACTPQPLAVDLDGARSTMRRAVSAPFAAHSRCRVSSWLDPVRAAVGEVTAPVDVFFRDDDAGWRDDRLLPLLDVFERAGAPIDLAAIPDALSESSARVLAARWRAAPARVRIHRHGFAHENHEPPDARKCEFGPSRPAELQYENIVRGQGLLHDRLGVAPDPVFTPPWNRCTADTARGLRAAGIPIFSRESRAAPLDVDGVVEVPVAVDWARLRRPELGDALAHAVRRGGPLGVMLHHAVMDAEDRGGVAELLGLLTASPDVRLTTIVELATTKAAA
jgi:peptidoglycan/xylan/chitin deacetylase (PgdA/CDA1 family)